MGGEQPFNAPVARMWSGNRGPRTAQCFVPLTQQKRCPEKVLTCPEQVQGLGSLTAAREWGCGVSLGHVQCPVSPGQDGNKQQLRDTELGAYPSLSRAFVGMSNKSKPSTC